MTPRNDIKREATSIKIDPQLWKQAKIEAIRNDLELSELVEQAIEKWIEDEAHKKVKGGRK
jgi:post-segregation antitoxin (ccd killing protein)